ncbi:sugar ABC transporter substrate-binding protein [Paenibacillus soyae]|uniref:Maltodextrin-binding protein n=1 Tax=Paenibacillus soyae TaxID=2969249 RepID=A0A9X2MTT0_9BACL|nr:maltose ABC transporter substrate-binding protein [Paenibacillus soyae]MCR2806679.1 maltose ABC transporter substrate-binding protein [Paenibacillus soyae]
MKKNKTKGIALLTLLLLLAVVAGACSGTGASNAGNAVPADSAGAENDGSEELAPEKGAKLVVWEAQEQVAYMEKVGKAFEEAYGVPVTVETVAGGDQGARLATDGPAKTAADILTLPHDQIGLAVKAGLLLPNDAYEEETRTSAVETAVAASSYEGVLYGYPKSVETYAMFYNKDLFPEPPQTWEEIIAFAKTYNKPDESKYAIMWEFVGYYSYPFIGSYGGYMFGDNNTNPDDLGINKGDVVKGFEFLRSLKEILPMNAGDITYDVKTQLFQDGKLALNVDGPWSVSAFKDQVNFGVAPLPSFPNGQPAISLSGVKSYYVNAYSEYPIAARMFAHFASSKENQLLNYEMTGAIPANIEAGEDPSIQNDPITSGFFRQFEQSVPMSSVAGVDLVWDGLQSAFVSLWNDPSLDIKQTLDQIAQNIKDGMAAK